MSSFAQSSFPPHTLQANGVPVYVEPARVFITPQLNTVLDMWHARRGGSTIPARSDFTIRDLKSVLRNLALMDIVQNNGATRYLVRYMGSELDSQLMPMTGHFADEILPPYFMEKWKAVWASTVEQRHPMRSISRAEFRDRSYSLVEALYAPLSDEGGTPDKLLIAVYYHELEAADVRTKGFAQRLMTEFTRRKENV